MRNSKGLESVDNALHLLLLLREHGRIRLSEAADSLGVARSTAHRLLSTLRNRGFAVQGVDKAYRPGPALYRLGLSARTDYELVEAARAPMLQLNEAVGETVHLMVRTGVQVRFLHSVEGAHALRVSSRAGALLPAHLASGGKALLAELTEGELGELYAADGSAGEGDSPEAAVEAGALHRRLDGVRRAGFAVNTEGTERGITAVGAAVHDAGGRAVAALAISAPSLRLPRSRLPEAATALREAVRHLEECL
ncbi:IclR family transcriptional regulator [Streptomyces sp. NBC_00316]|uniref:IclR family transcriptional regulator n=1 Tax=Streptomyces sp. NBC_00316 TaxID=2975710 RepID=UPI002E2D2A29|nr:IclR family transcriptional regulator [Streptomyces sp. NBC_00316]